MSCSISFLYISPFQTKYFNKVSFRVEIPTQKEASSTGKVVLGKKKYSGKRKTARLCLPCCLLADRPLDKIPLMLPASVSWPSSNDHHVPIRRYLLKLFFPFLYNFYSFFFYVCVRLSFCSSYLFIPSYAFQFFSSFFICAPKGSAKWMEGIFHGLKKRSPMDWCCLFSCFSC